MTDPVKFCYVSCTKCNFGSIVQVPICEGSSDARARTSDDYNFVKEVWKLLNDGLKWRLIK